MLTLATAANTAVDGLHLHKVARGLGEQLAAAQAAQERCLQRQWKMPD
jgi:hypothetical protein